MQKIIHVFKAKMLPILALAVFIGISASFSVAAAQKIWVSVKKQTSSNSLVANTELENTSPASSKKVVVKPEHLQNDSEDKGENFAQKITTQTQEIQKTALAVQANQNLQIQNSVNATTSSAQSNTTKTFTVAELATHNVSGNCYVVYKGTVYDVSNASVWAGCKHHGAVGGKDITSLFPHPTSYFNSLPVVGVMASTTTSTNASNNSTSSTSVQTENSQKKYWEDDEDDDDYGSRRSSQFEEED